MAHRTPAPLRAVGALLGLALLVALVVGVPYLLLAVGHQPTELTGGTDLLMQQDDGSLFLVVLTCLGWAGWAAFTFSTLLEIVAVLRRRSAPRIKGLGGLQSLASFLIGGIVLLAPTAASAATVAPAVAATAVHTAGETTSAVTPSTKSEEGASPQHTVATATELPWDLAEVYLGDGTRWKDIAALNPDISQLTAGDQFLPKGAVIKLPADARSIEAAASTTPSASSTRTADEIPEGALQTQSGSTRAAGDEYVVEAGDSLSKIASDELVTESRYSEIFELNKGEAQPGGGRFTDPDRIFPGQSLTLPASAATPEHTAPSAGDQRHPNETPAPHASDGAEQHHNDEARKGGQEREDDHPSPTAPSAPTAGPSTAPGPAAPASPPKEGTPPASSTPSSVPPQAAPSAAVDREKAEAADSSVQQVALVAGIGALLAASLAGALGVKRILQQRRRRAGERIAIDSDPSLLEQIFHTSGEPASGALLDLALRTLAGLAGADTQLPLLRGARITGRTVHLLIEDRSAAPLAPFTAGEEPGVWVLDPKAELLDEEAASQVPAPYPGLVTLGATEDGDLLLANLLNRVLLLDGEPDDILAVTRALALESGTCGWSDHTEIMTVGLGSRLATLLPKGRVRTMPKLQSVVADLGSLLVEVHQQDEDAPSPLPWILICSRDADGDQVWQLADAVSAARKLPIAVVLPANDATRQAFPDAETIPTAPGAPVTVPDLVGTPLVLQRLTDEQYLEFIHALEVTEEPALPATGAWKLSEDHTHAAGDPLTGPHTLYVDEGSTDPGNPFPALLASATSDKSDAVEASAEAGSQDGQGESGSPMVPEQAARADGDHIDDQAEDPAAPEIRVLGTLQVSGISSSGHGPKVGALAALIYLRPGRSAEALCTAMDPVNPWSTRTLQSRLSEIRSRFGTAADGQPYLPRLKNGYAFRTGIRCDWDRFQELATRGLAAGPDTGIRDLENALGLVRGKPFEGQDYPWADSIQHEIISRVVDTAHTLAAWLSEGDTPDMDAARHAVLRGLDVDETSEVLYRDWMRIEWATGNTTGVRKAIARLQQVTRTYDISLDPLTEQVIDLVLSQEPEHAAAR
ncbi:LysM peptidoglycan-binding domain-containing protein [Streptomyces sp. NPDC002793]|uniref:LysM peptidoglycan-binding domain-containing protein n=1 Tax=Streptomyces sp. NPDC002793 TaxID=3154432 RepID=UPI00332AA06B